MAYVQRVRHRNLHEMHKEIGNIVIRDPQKPDVNSKGGGNAGGNSKTDARTSAASNPITADANDSVSNVVSVVFVTATPTFTGEVAGYVTLTRPTPESSPEPSPQPPVTYVVDQPQNIEPSSTEVAWTPASSAVAPAETNTQAPPSTNFEPATTYMPSPASTSAPVVVAASSEPPSSSLPTSVVMAVSSSTLLSSYLPRSSAAFASRSLESMAPSSTAATAAAATSSEGMTPGGKAGLAIGIIAIIGLIAGGVLWLIWKKKKSNQWQKADDGKDGFGGVFGAMADKRQSAKPFAAQSEHQNPSAPRLSLRPVTQFIPDLAGAKKRLSQGNPLNQANKPTGMAAAGASRNLTRDNPNGSAWERRVGGETAANPFKDPVSPFGDQVKVAATPPPPNVTVTPPRSEDGTLPPAVPAAAMGVAVGAAGAAVVAGAAIAAGAGKNGHGQLKNRPDSPAGGPSPANGPPAGNVYRVQVDFKPSMEDELELSSGQLVRLLHEYDDGWALCVRLDRSQQGVAPRTCLSARPVKPRPANGSPRMGPNGRPMTPNDGRPMSPAQSRPMSPAGGPGARPRSPASSNGPSRPGTAHSNRALSPPSHGQVAMMPQNSNQMAPGQFNQAPRPLSPGPVTRGPNTQQPKRSQSPGPYGASSGPAPMSPNQRRRSNSAGAVQARRNSPPGSSPLGREDPMPGWKPPKPPAQNRTPGVAF